MRKYLSNLLHRCTAFEYAVWEHEMQISILYVSLRRDNLAAPPGCGRHLEVSFQWNPNGDASSYQEHIRFSLSPLRSHLHLWHLRSSQNPRKLSHRQLSLQGLLRPGPALVKPTTTTTTAAATTASAHACGTHRNSILCTQHGDRRSQHVVLRPVAPAWPGNLLDIYILGPRSRPMESETLEWAQHPKF